METSPATTPAAAAAATTPAAPAATPAAPAAMDFDSYHALAKEHVAGVVAAENDIRRRFTAEMETAVADMRSKRMETYNLTIRPKLRIFATQQIAAGLQSGESDQKARQRAKVDPAVYMYERGFDVAAEAAKRRKF